MPVASNASARFEVGSVAPSLAVDGLFSGLIGGITVALFFLVLDSLAGRPLYTPSLLGSVIFLGASVDQVEQVSVGMTLAYTALHMALFVAAGMAAALMVAQFERRRPMGVILLVVFACLEAGFYIFATGLAPGVFAALGTYSVGAANVLAACVMAVYFWRAHLPGRDP